MTFTQAVRSVLSSYATFSGRARRSEYWWFYLFTILVAITTSVIDAVLNTAFDNEIGIVGTITSLALLLPTLAVTARRLHDTGRAGWWMLLPAIPLVATIAAGFAAVFLIAFSTNVDSNPEVAVIALLGVCVLLTLAAGITLTVFLCLNSKPEANKYGPSPKQPRTLPTGPEGHYPPTGHGTPYGYPQQPPATGSYTPSP
jgi:uncharacterized membrane protein YhaH (DUF805 family)